MNSRLLSAVVLMLLALGTTVLPAPAAAADRSCGTAVSKAGDTLTVTVKKPGRCGKAVSIMRSYYKRDCGTGSGNSCAIRVRGYRCASNTYAETQRTGIATTCRSGKRVITARVKNSEPSGSGAPIACGKVASGATEFLVRVRGGKACGAARSIMRRYIARTASCSSASDPSCAATVSHYRCRLAPSEDRPAVLYRCTKGRRTVEAGLSDTSTIPIDQD